MQDVNKLKEIQTYIGHEDYVTCVTEIPNESNSLIASSSVDKLIHLWDVNSGESIKVLSGHTSIINSIQAFNENYIAAADDDANIKIWDIRNCETVLCKSHAHKDWIKGLCVLEDKFIVSASKDQKIKIWKIGEMQNGCCGIF